MAKKIAKTDAAVMNSLYAAELTKAGVKTAAEDNGQDPGIQAFKDHEEYQETLKNAMSADASIEGTDPNNVITD